MSESKLWNKDFCKVMTANFALFFAFYLLMPLLPLYMSEHYGSTKDLIGVVLSGYTITAMLVRPFSGYVVDSFPRKRVLLVCYGLFFIFFAGYLAAGSLLLFAVVRTLHGAPFGAATVANSTVAIDVLPSQHRSEGIGYYGLSNNIAMATAPSVALAIYHYVNSFEVLFWLALIVAGIGLAVNATVHLPERPVVKGKQPLLLDRFFLLEAWIVALSMVCFGYSFGVLSNYLAIYGKEVLHHTEGTGTYFLILAAGLILSRLQGAKALRQGRILHNAFTGMALSFCGYLLFVAVPNAWGYYGSAVLIGLGNGHMWPAFLNIFIDIAGAARRGTANSSLLISWDIGMGLGVLMGGILADACGYTIAFRSTAVATALGVLLFVVIGRKEVRQNNNLT